MPKKVGKRVESLKHAEDKRRNIPTAEFRSLLKGDEEASAELRYPRNTDLDPQLVWRGKDEQDWSDLVVQAPPLYIQEKVHPKVLIDDLLRETAAKRAEEPGFQTDLFSDFNGVPEGAETEFYQHDQNWSNRLILGDALQVMASLAEREGLRGKVQCIYIDPPYGIKFNSNFQWSTTTRTVRDGKAEHITREPEQVKAFRDTWRDGVHSYLTYLRDRLTLARDLLTDTGSVFVQIGDENVHLVRSVLDEIFGPDNAVVQIVFRKKAGTGSALLEGVADYILWYAKDRKQVKYRQLYFQKERGGVGGGAYRWVVTPEGERRPGRPEDSSSEALSWFRPSPLTSERPAQSGDLKSYSFEGVDYTPGRGTFNTNKAGLDNLALANRLIGTGKTLQYVRHLDDFPAVPLSAFWTDTQSGSGMDKVYVVQTTTKVVERCLLMASDPGDLVLDPTCGSGTTAYVAEQWGRRWITIDTSRVALALARVRLMGARYPFFLLADSVEGQQKEAEITRSAPSTQPVGGSIRHGFVYERVPHITLKSIANNAEIQVIWKQWQEKLEPLRSTLNAVLKADWEDWEVPRLAEESWPETAKDAHAAWWHARTSRQGEIDASITAKADVEYLYDRPYQDSKKVRVAGPFTVESLSPHRVLAVDENDELIDGVNDLTSDVDRKMNFPQMILENLKNAGVQQAHKEDRIAFTALTPWPGLLVCGEGIYMEGETEKRAGIFIGPEFGTVQRADLVEAAREAGDAGFDVLISCAFNYEAHTTEFTKLGRIPVLKARMNADLHMADDLKNTGKGNLFVIFGEPDIEVLDDVEDQIRVKVNGVDVFKPQTGEVISDGADGIACWFLDTDYNEESFFVRQAYFLGANDPYKALKTTLKAEIDLDAWATLNSDTSRPFPRPSHGRIAVKVINHLGDEVMKVFKP